MTKKAAITIAAFFIFISLSEILLATLAHKTRLTLIFTGSYPPPVFFVSLES